MGWRDGRPKPFFPGIRRYVEAATRRSLYVANTGVHPRAINHCHPRGPAREKVRGSRVGRKLAREEKQKNEERRRGREAAAARLECVSNPVPLSLRARDASLSVERDSGVFSRRSTRYTVGICRFVEKKRDRNYVVVVQVDFRLTLYIHVVLSSSLTYDREDSTVITMMSNATFTPLKGKMKSFINVTIRENVGERERETAWKATDCKSVTKQFSE